MFIKIILILILLFYMKGGGLTFSTVLSDAPKLTNYDNLDFRYTFSKNRIKWITNIYPYSYIFLEIPNLIEWNEFQYIGSCEICTQNPEDNPEENPEDNPTFNPNLISNDELYKYSIGLVSSTSDLPKYIFFGGCVYEIISRKYPKVNLNEFIDPTGDIDILLQLPKLKLLNTDIKNDVPTNFNQDYYFFVQSDKTNETDPPTWLNSYICALGKWLVESITNVLTLELDTPEKIRTMFPDIKEFDIDRYDELKPYYKKEKLGYNLKDIHGLIYIASFIVGDMYKIQVIMKIGNEIDHVLEFVYAGIVCKHKSYFRTNNKDETYFNIDINGIEYKIDDVSELIIGNLSAYAIRNKIIHEKYKISYHKAINHVGRLLYLLELEYQYTTPRKGWGKDYNYLVLSSKKSEIFFSKMISILFEPAYDTFEQFQSMIYINNFDKDQILKTTNIKYNDKMTIIAEYMLHNLYFFYVKNSRLIKIPFIDIIIGYNKYFNLIRIPGNYFIKNYYFINKLTDFQYQTLHDVFIQEYITENERIHHNKAAIKIQSFFTRKIKPIKTFDPLRHDTYNPIQLFEETTLQRLFKQFVRENLEKKAAKKIQQQLKTYKFRKAIKMRTTAKSRARTSEFDDVPELERSDLDLLFPTRNILKANSLTSKKNYSAKRKQYNSI
jgi:hypothetical protein